MTAQRDKFESAVVRRLQESGFLEVEIRTECLARVDQGYQDEVINAGWHYWNEALWQNIPLVDPVLGRSPDGLDFATPDEVFDKGPEAVREWQEARGRKAQITTSSPPPTGIALLQDGTLNLAFVANALAFYANHIEGRPQRGDCFPADLRLAAQMLVGQTPPPSSHVAPDEQEDRFLDGDLTGAYAETGAKRPLRLKPAPEKHVAALDAHSQSLLAAQNNVIDGLMAENEQLRKALAPFAEVADRFDGVPVSAILPQQCWFTPHSLREARAAIATTEQTK